MSEAQDPTLLHRCRHTPMRDLVRGRMTGRLDWRRVIAEAEIPGDAKALLVRLVRRTRLWRSEKVEVAADLIAHFRDAIEDGQAPASVIQRFGDWHRTAKLIRRASKRKRPLLWQAWRVSFWFGVAFVVLYVLMGMYYLTGSRNIAVDYSEVLNARAAAVPEEDRAWPVLRQAMLELGLTHSLRQTGDDGEPTADALLDGSARPGDDRWPEVVAYLDAHRDAIADLRRAAGMPGLGFVAGYLHDPADLPLFEPDRDPADYARETAAIRAQHREQPPMSWSILLPHLGTLRSAGHALGCDTFRAAEAGDRDVVYANLIAVFGLADHADEQNPLINQLVAVSLRRMGLQHLSEIQASYLGLLSNEQLVSLAHRISPIRKYTPDPSGERHMADDLIQHLYTDDGRGGGRLDLNAWSQRFPELQTNEAFLLPEGHGMDLLATTVGPAVVTFAAGREEVTALVDRLFALHAQDMTVPMWQQPQSLGDAEWLRLQEEPIYRRARIVPAFAVLPAIGAVRRTAEQYNAEADATLTAIALELYRREHGGYPETLSELTPRYLPEAPIDRITGGPLRYRVVEGRPVLYSVGADHDDDGGTFAYTGDGERDRHNVVRWVIPEGETALDGDWVVWPLHDELVNR